MHVSPEQKLYLRNMLIEGKKIEAIKYIHDEYKLSLREAKRLAELIDEDIRDDEYQFPLKRVIKHGKKAGSIVGIVFASIGLIMLMVAGLFFISNRQIASTGQTVKGKVISNPSQPVFEYEFNGKLYQHYSDVSSNPPSYVIGEEVNIIINPESPNNVLVDTFLDRWFAITLVGGMGAVFLMVGLTAFVFLRNR